jgi:hypothetical protein
MSPGFLQCHKHQDALPRAARIVFRMVIYEGLRMVLAGLGIGAAQLAEKVLFVRAMDLQG